MYAIFSLVMPFFSPLQPLTCHHSSLMVFFFFCIVGEPQLVSGPQHIPAASYSALQLPGGRRPHQPRYDPRHVSHESPQWRLAAAIPVRALHDCHKFIFGFAMLLQYLIQYNPLYEIM